MINIFKYIFPKRIANPIRIEANRALKKVFQFSKDLYGIIFLTQYIPRINIKKLVINTVTLAPTACHLGIKNRLIKILITNTIPMLKVCLLCLSQAFNNEPIGKLMKMKKSEAMAICRGNIAPS